MILADRYYKTLPLEMRVARATSMLIDGGKKFKNKFGIHVI